MQFLTINLARMKGAKVLQSNGLFYIGVPIADKWCKNNETIICNFVMNETTQFGHTFVVAESTKNREEQMPIIGHCNPYIPRTSEEAGVVTDVPEEFIAQQQGNGQQLPQAQQPPQMQQAPVMPQQNQSQPINPTTNTPVDINDPMQKAIPGAFGEWFDYNGKEIPRHLLPLYHQ